MNETAPFFAFLPDDAKDTLLLNKHQVAVLSVPPFHDDDAESEDAELPVRHVTLEIGERGRVEGDLVIDMPVGQRRVLDFLNRPEAFLTLRGVGRWHLVRRSLVTRVIETREG